MIRYILDTVILELEIINRVVFLKMSGDAEGIGDVFAGKLLFLSKCSTCHSVEKGGKSKAGPPLHGIMGKKAGSIPGFRYSEAMKNSGEYST